VALLRVALMTEYLTVGEAAWRLGLTTAECWHLINDGRLRSVDRPAGRMVPASAVVA
jgi:hypothetical protein